MDAGAAYFEAILRFNKMEAQIRELEKKQQKIHYEAVLNAGSLRTQLNRSLSSLNRSIDISANVTVQGLDKLRSSYGTFATFAGNALNDALQKSLDLATQGVQAVVGTAVGFSSESVKSFADVSSQLNVIQQKAGASNLEIKQLEQAIVSTAANTSLLPQGASELADTLATAGLQITEINKLLQPLAAGSAGLGRSAANLGGDVATLANAFNLNAGSDGNTIINAIAATATSANLTADNLAASTKYFRSQQKGIEGVAQSFQSIALLAQGGLVGSSAGTSLNALFTQAIKNSDKLKEQLNVDIKDRNGNLKGETQILQELREAYLRLQNDVGTAEALGAATQLFQTRGARALTAVAKLSDETINKTIQSVNRFQTEDIAGNLESAALKGLGGAFLGLENQIAALQFSIGSKLSPAVEVVVRSVTKIIEQIQGNKPLIDSIGDAAQRFADALSAPQVQASLVQVGEILVGLIQQGVDFIANKALEIGELIQQNPEILQQIATTISSIVSSTFELLSGLVQIGFQIASAIAPLVSVEGIVSTLKLVISNTIELAGVFFTAFNAGAGESVLSINNLQAGINAIFDILQPVAALFGGISGVLSQVAIAVIDITQNSGVQGFLDNLTSTITSISGQVQNTIPSLINTITSALASFAGGVGSGIARAGIESPDFQLPTLDLSSTVRGFGEVLGEVGANVFNLVSRISEIIVNSVLPSIVRIGQALAPVATSLLATVFELVKQLTPLIEKIVNGMINFIDNNLPGLQSFLLQA
ncbi:MAG: phage tail tape measure protein, partial [Cyanobacteria bacterium J06635_10]